MNVRGASSPSASVKATVGVRVQPDAPTITYFGSNGPGQAWVVSFSPGGTNGATVTGWEASVDGGPWTSAAQVTTPYASFPCVSVARGWSYSTPIRLRAVTASGHFEPSQPHAPGDI